MSPGPRKDSRVKATTGGYKSKISEEIGRVEAMGQRARVWLRHDGGRIADPDRQSIGISLIECLQSHVPVVACGHPSLKCRL